MKLHHYRFLPWFNITCSQMRLKSWVSSMALVDAFQIELPRFITNGARFTPTKGIGQCLNKLRVGRAWWWG